MGSGSSKTPRPGTSSSQASVYQDQPITLGKNGLPLPRPTRTKKLDLIADLDFEVFDECAIEAPLDLLLGTFWQVVEYLVITPDGDLLDEMLRIRTLFRWVASFDVYNIESEIIPPPDSPLEYFLNIQYGMGDHAQLLYILCELADIPCMIIEGVTKSGSYEVGGKLDRDEMGSQWNAVFISGQWRFIDVFWSIYCADGNDNPVFILVDSKGVITRFCEGEVTPVLINEFYYLTDPDALIWTHFPHQKEWQLLKTPIGIDEFENRVYVREMFTNLGMSIKDKSKLNCHLESDGHPIEIEFNLPKDRSENFKFMYSLFQTRKELETDKRIDIFLERFVGFEHTQKSLRYIIRFPFTGKFQMDIFGCDLSMSESFELICTYIIECNNVMENCLPFPDCPAIGWGLNPHAEKYGLVTISPKNSYINTNNGEAEIRVKLAKDYHICHSLKSLEVDDAVLSKYSISRCERDELILNIRLPKSGEYALKIFANIYENNELLEDTNILNFLIVFKDEKVKTVPFPDIIGNHLGKKEGAKLLNVFPLSNPSGYIKGWDGKARLEFEAKQPDTKLYCEGFSTRRIANRRMGVEDREEDGLWVFNIDMPIKGEYSVNIFATKDDNVEIIYDIYSCIINSTGYSSKRVKFDDDAAIDEIPTQAICTSDTQVKISIRNDFKALFRSIHQRDAKDIDPEISKKGKIEMINSSLEVTVEIYGEYLIDVFGLDEENRMNAVGRYIIDRRNSQDTYHEDIKALLAMLKPEIEKEEDEIFIDEKNAVDNKETHIDKNEYTDNDSYNYEDLDKDDFDETILENNIKEENNNETKSDDDDDDDDDDNDDDDDDDDDEDLTKSGDIEGDNQDEQKESSNVNSEVDDELHLAELGLALSTIHEAKEDENCLPDINDNDENLTERSDIYDKNEGDVTGRYNSDSRIRFSVAESDGGMDTARHSIQMNMTPTEKKERIRLAQQKRSAIKIKKAMRMNDLKVLMLNLQIYKSTEPPDGDTLESAADRAVELIRAKQYLIWACQTRRKGLLAKAIKRAKEVNFDKKLDMQIIIATRVLNRLNKIEQLSSKIMELNQNVLTEMKQYHKPPRGVHQVLVATSLLLGDNLADLKDWQTCKKFLYKTGKENILRRISQFDPRDVEKEVAFTAKSLIGSFTMLEIRDVSRGAAVFYMWVKGMINEIESLYSNKLRKSSSFGSGRPALPRSSSMYKIRARRDSTLVMRL